MMPTIMNIVVSGTLWSDEDVYRMKIEVVRMIHDGIFKSIFEWIKDNDLRKTRIIVNSGTVGN